LKERNGSRISYSYAHTDIKHTVVKESTRTASFRLYILYQGSFHVRYLHSHNDKIHLRAHSSDCAPWNATVYSRTSPSQRLTEIRAAGMYRVACFNLSGAQVT